MPWSRPPANHREPAMRPDLTGLAMARTHTPQSRPSVSGRAGPSFPGSAGRSHATQSAVAGYHVCTHSSWCQWDRDTLTGSGGDPAGAGRAGESPHQWRSAERFTFAGEGAAEAEAPRVPSAHRSHQRVLVPRGIRCGWINRASGETPLLVACLTVRPAPPPERGTPQAGRKASDMLPP